MTESEAASARVRSLTYDRLLMLCGSCDAGLPMACTCPPLRELQLALLEVLGERDGVPVRAIDRLLDFSHPGHCYDECDQCVAWNKVKGWSRG